MRYAVLFASLAGALGCLGPRPAVPVRTFRPELAERAERAARADAPQLLLRRVTAAAHLRDRMAWRTSEVEYGFHENLRWAEEPAVYAGRALERALFHEGAFRRTERPGATVEAELRAFEEVRSPAREAVVTLAVRLWDDGGESRLGETVSARRPLPDADPATVARLLGAALDEAADEAARRLAAALGTAPR